MNFMHNKIMMDQVDPVNGAAGGSGYVPPVVDDKKVAVVPASAPVEGEEAIDDLGYAVVAAPKDEKKVEEKLDKKPDLKEPEKVENPASGYDKEPVKLEEEAPAKVEEKPDVDLGYELKVDPIIPKDEVTKIKDFAKKHGLTKEVSQAYFDLRKTEVAEMMQQEAAQIKNFEKEKQATRAKWHKELKEDPTFGGEKFGHNVLRAEKVLQDFMPGTKKELTARGSMLPPYVMRDLAKLADHLYATDKLVNGDPSVPNTDDKEEDDGTDFYKS